MATELFSANRATTAVPSGGTDAPSGGTQETWTVASSAMFGAASTGVSQFHVADPAAPSEMILVTNVSGTTWTVTRGAEGTTPVTHSAGFTVYQVITAGFLGEAITTASLAIPGSLAASSSSMPPMAYQALGGGHSAKLQNWFINLALSGGESVTVACAGDSFTSGGDPGVTSWAQTWPPLLQKLLVARYPSVSATGSGRGLLPPDYPTSGVPLPYVTVTGTPTVDYGPGFNLAAYDISAGGGCTLTYSLVGDNAVIAYLQQSGGGTFHYKVDSGSYTPVNTNGTYADGTAVFVSLGSAGSHTLTIAWVSGGATVIDAVIEFDGDLNGGVQVYNCGLSGSTTSSWTYSTWTAFEGASVGVVVLELGGNDQGSNVAPATTKANLTTIISSMRTALGAAMPAVLLAAPAQYLPSATYPWSQYVAGMYAIAAADPYTDVLDLTLRMPAIGSGYAPNTLYNSSTGELTPAAHQMVANAVCSFLSPA